MRKMKLSPAQKNLLEMLKGLEYQAEGKRYLWYDPKKISEKEYQIPKIWSGVAVLSTLKALTKKDVLSYEGLGKYGTYWKVTLKEGDEKNERKTIRFKTGEGDEGY